MARIHMISTKYKTDYYPQGFDSDPQGSVILARWHGRPELALAAGLPGLVLAVAYDHALDMEGNHVAAAEALGLRLGVWDGGRWDIKHAPASTPGGFGTLIFKQRAGNDGAGATA